MISTHYGALDARYPKSHRRNARASTAHDDADDDTNDDDDERCARHVCPTTRRGEDFARDVQDDEVRSDAALDVLTR